MIGEILILSVLALVAPIPMAGQPPYTTLLVIMIINGLAQYMYAVRLSAECEQTETIEPVKMGMFAFVTTAAAYGCTLLFHNVIVGGVGDLLGKSLERYHTAASIGYMSFWIILNTSFHTYMYINSEVC